MGMYYYNTHDREGGGDCPFSCQDERRGGRGDVHDLPRPLIVLRLGLQHILGNNNNKI